MSLESSIAELIAGANQLTDQVMALLSGNGVDTKTIYVSPGASGSGETQQDPCSLQCAIDNKLTSFVNEVRLTGGEHVLADGTKIDTRNVIFRADAYNPANPPIICTEHTTTAYVSDTPAGCISHNYVETPLALSGCQVRFENIWIKGTSRCLVLQNNTTVVAAGDFKLSLFIPNSTREGRFMIVNNSKFIAEKGGNSNLHFRHYHPCYTTVGAPLGQIGSIEVRGGSFSVVADVGSFLIEANGRPDWYGTTLTDGFHGENASIHIGKLSVKNLQTAMYLSENSAGYLGYMDMEPDSAPLQKLSFCQGSRLWIGEDGVWTSDARIVRVECEQATGLVQSASGSATTLKNIILRAGGQSHTFAFNSAASQMAVRGCQVLAEDRAANLGFERMFVNQMSANVSIDTSAFTARNSGADLFCLTSDGGISTNLYGTNTITATTEYTVLTGGKYIDNAGVVHE